MNEILQKKLNELNIANDYECWYLVKQPTAFDNLCYLVSFLAKFKQIESSGNIQDYIGKCISDLRKTKPNLEISNNYRALRVAAFLGLITMTSSKYDEAIITDTFKEITSRCNGEYEKTNLYADIIKRQIEKMYISSEIDEASEGVRKKYRLYPVMLLYKILLEIGRATGQYTISMTEYRYIVATTQTFEDFLDTLVLIKLLRLDTDNAIEKFEQYRTKFDNRLIQALKQLDTLIIDKDTIKLNIEKVDEVSEKLFIFEKNPNLFTTRNYLSFLGSTMSLFDLKTNNKPEQLNKSVEILKGYNKIYYGIPGCGKSYYIENTVLDGVDKENNVFRTTFYLDYSNSDFIGQIYPVVDGDRVKYEPIPGPFTKALERALTNKDESIYLVIEEINRGNAAAIFGDTFQLLDRLKVNKNGRVVGDSEYPISNAFIEDYLKKKGVEYTPGNIYIPHNLTLLATMNTSDQNVFPLDTAFKRRWNREKVTNNWEEVGNIKNMYIPYSSVTWETFAQTINKEMINKSAKEDAPISEDKQMGAYFADESMLTETPNDKDGDKIDSFANNVLDYLFNDVTKFNHKILFEEHILTTDKIYERIEMYKNAVLKESNNVGAEQAETKNIFSEIFTKDISTELVGNAKKVDDDND